MNLQEHSIIFKHKKLKISQKSIHVYTHTWYLIIDNTKL